MIDGLVSINTALNEAIRDLHIGQVSLPIADFKEWIIESLKAVGVTSQNEKRTAKVTIKNYQGDLPADYYNMDKILSAHYYNPDLVLDDDNDVADNAEIVPDKTRTVNSSDVNIQFKHVTTSFEEGEVEISYWAIPLDKNGYAMLPSNYSYKELFMWTIAYRLSIQGFKFQNPELNSIRFTGTHYRHYIKQARGDGRMPNKLLMERLKNDFLTLVFNPHKANNNYRELGNQETLMLDSRNMYS